MIYRPYSAGDRVGRIRVQMKDGISTNVIGEQWTTADIFVPVTQIAGGIG